MAYKRSYKKRTYKRRGGPRATKAKQLVEGKGSTRLEKIAWGLGGMASVARAVLPYIKANNAEAKYFDTNFSVSPVLATPGLNNITAMSQGLTDITRIGNSIKLKDLKVRVTLSPNFTTNTNNLIRIMILVDKMQDGTLPTYAQIFEVPTVFNSPLNKDFTDRFVLLRDKYITLNSGGDNELFFDMYLKLDYHVRYLGPGNAGVDQGPGTIYILSWSREAVNAPTIQYYNRINYYDN